MRRYLAIIIFVVFCGTSSTAQSKFALTYNIGFPTGETSDFFNSTSWRGINIDYHHLIEDHFAVGFSTGWQVFSRNVGFVTETTGTETVSGFRFNYLNNFPILATGSYFVDPYGELSPFFSLGIGLTYSELERDLGLFRDSSNGWPFTLRPEIGVDYEINYNFGLRASFRYNYMASGRTLPSLPFFSANVGFVWHN